MNPAWTLQGRSALASWLGAIASGAALGALIAAAHHLGWLAPLGNTIRSGATQLTAWIGPVWVPMALVAIRVASLGARAWRTRFSRTATGRPVRPELYQLAPLFPALGLAGTVWGLGVAFDALDRGEFLARLPALLAGLGAAMTSTLVGLGLQVATLLLASLNPAWSLARVEARAGGLHFELDRLALGSGLEGLGRVLAALDARRPEALRVAFEGVGATDRRSLLAVLAERSDASLPLRVATG